MYVASSGTSERVTEALGQLHAGGRAGDGGADVDGIQRQVAPGWSRVRPGRLPARPACPWSAVRCQWSCPALLGGLLLLQADGPGLQADHPGAGAVAPVGQFPDQRPAAVTISVTSSGPARARALKQQHHPRCEPDTVHEPGRGKGGTAIRWSTSAAGDAGGRAVPARRASAGWASGGAARAGLAPPGPAAGRRRPGRRAQKRDGAAKAACGAGRCPGRGRPRQRLVGRARQLGLDLGERSSLRLTALDRYELKQVPLPVLGDPAPAAQRRVDQPDGDVPANQAFVRHVPDAAIYPRRTRSSPTGRLRTGPGPTGRLRAGRLRAGRLRTGPGPTGRLRAGRLRAGPGRAPAPPVHRPRVRPAPGLSTAPPPSDVDTVIITVSTSACTGGSRESHVSGAISGWPRWACGPGNGAGVAPAPIGRCGPTPKSI